MNKDIKQQPYVYAGLIITLGAALGLLISILFQKNIPLSLLLGGVIGLLIGSLVWYLLIKKIELNNDEKDL